LALGLVPVGTRREDVARVLAQSLAE